MQFFSENVPKKVPRGLPKGSQNRKKSVSGSDLGVFEKALFRVHETLVFEGRGAQESVNNR